MRLTKKVIPLLAILFCTTILAQTTTAQPQNQGQKNLENQLQDLIENSNNFQEYKVISKNSINNFLSEFSESIKDVDKVINEKDATIARQQNQIDSLSKELQEVKETLAELREEKDEMQFLGLSTDKGIYNSIVWSIIGILALGLIFFVIRFMSSRSKIVHARRTLAETEEEFADYKKRSLTKEQKLTRQLQDELNRRGGY